MPTAFHASAVITGDAESLRDGALVVDDDGTVIEAGRAGDVLARHAGISVERVHGVIFPGLVNAHTHLELSALRGKVPGGAGFVPWVEGMLGARYEAAPEEDVDAITRAVSELEAFATVAVGDVTNTLAAVPALAKVGMGGSIFHEVFGVERERAMDRVAQIDLDWQGARATWGTNDLRYSPAPHTLYTTHSDAVRALLDRARALGARSTLHLAEHPAERLALEKGVGPIPDWFRARLKIDRVAWPLVPPIRYADSLGAIAADVLLVHLTDAHPEELDLIAKRGAPVVLCPRSNLHIEMQLPPLLTALRAGIAPALGTDSLASNASLDVLAEARALMDRFPSIAPRTLVRMATFNGAVALGRPDLGRFVKGTKPGIFAVMGEMDSDPDTWLLTNVKAPRRKLMGRRHS